MKSNINDQIMRFTGSWQAKKIESSLSLIESDNQAPISLVAYNLI